MDVQTTKLEDKIYKFQPEDSDEPVDVERIVIRFNEVIKIQDNKVFNEGDKVFLKDLFTNKNANNFNFKTKKNVARGYSILQHLKKDSYILTAGDGSYRTDGGSVILTKIENPILMMGDDELIAKGEELGSKKFYDGFSLEILKETTTEQEEEEKEEQQEEEKEEDEKPNSFEERFATFIEDGFEVFVAGDKDEYRLLYKQGADPILVRLDEEQDTILDYEGDEDEEEGTKHLFKDEQGEQIKFFRKNVDSDS